MKPGCLLLLALLTIGPLQNTRAQEPAVPDSLTNVLVAKEKEMFAIVMRGNKPEAENLFAPDYITINADGVMQDKEETMKMFGRFKGATSDLSEKKIRVYGNIAIINGRCKAHMKSILAADFLYTQIWLYRAGSWQFIGWQGTMTGIPSWYPVIITTVLLVLLFFITRLVIRKFRKQ